ncbi:MAG: hypothetical protein IPK19_15275 [Chloroflexi bacterium]|nr:hypothetical protein [Chloroflexota bacterium]
MTRAAWVLRGLLAALLGFSSEILLWTAPDTRPLFDWLVLVIAYLALSALLLELAARFRLRDLYGLLALAGIYGLLNAALLNPATAFVDFPRTFFTRAMGGHTLMGLLALALWLRLAGGRAFRPAGWIVSALLVAALGLVWGYWAHYAPTVFATERVTGPVADAVTNATAAPLTTVLLLAGLFAALLLALAAALRRMDAVLPIEAFRLSRIGWGFVIVALTPVAAAQFSAGALDGVQLTTVALFALFCAGIIWFQKRQKGATLLDNRTTAVPLPALAALLIVFVAAGAIGYHLPRGDVEADPLAVIGSLLTAYGLVWLPMVAFVLGAREFNKQARAMRL